MKKLLTILLATLMLLTLAACNKKETIDEPSPIEEPPVVENVGGWTINDDETVPQVSEEGLNALNKALENYTGSGFTPIIEMARQVVAGTNYMFLAKQTVVTATPIKKLAVVTVYEDLDGNSEILNVEDFEITVPQSDDTSNNLDLVGSWTMNDSLVTINLPADAQSAFDGVFAEMTGAAYEPLALLATQVVAGQNYAILTKQTLITENPVENLCVAYIYAALDGTYQLLGVNKINFVLYNAK